MAPAAEADGASGGGLSGETRKKIFNSTTAYFRDQVGFLADSRVKSGISHGFAL